MTPRKIIAIVSYIAGMVMIGMDTPDYVNAIGVYLFALGHNAENH